MIIARIRAIVNKKFSLYSYRKYSKSKGAEHL